MFDVSNSFGYSTMLIQTNQAKDSFVSRIPHPKYDSQDEERAKRVGRRAAASRARVNGPTPKLQKHRVEAGVMAFRFFCLIFGNYAARKASNLVARPESCLRETSPDDSSANNRDGCQRGWQELPVDDSPLSPLPGRSSSSSIVPTSIVVDRVIGSVLACSPRRNSCSHGPKTRPFKGLTISGVYRHGCLGSLTPPLGRAHSDEAEIQERKRQ